jgi:prefoldin subunit 5
MTQEEAIAKLNAQATQLAKVRAEVQKFIDAAQNQGNVSPELEAAINSVQDAIQGVDDLNTDETTEETQG